MRNLLPTVCKKDNQVQLEFQPLSTRRVVADIQGGQITSDAAGALLLRQVGEYTRILDDMAGWFLNAYWLLPVVTRT